LRRPCGPRGVPARYVDLHKGSHFSTEVWSKRHSKWVVMDATFESYFKRNGVPQSGLELHEMAIKGNFSGLKAISLRTDKPTNLAEHIQLAKNFYTYSIVLRANHMQRPVRFEYSRDPRTGVRMATWYDAKLFWSDEKVISSRQVGGYYFYSNDVRDFHWSPEPFLAVNPNP